jgi:hypothetical protein
MRTAPLWSNKSPWPPHSSSNHKGLPCLTSTSEGLVVRALMTKGETGRIAERGVSRGWFDCKS